jgi:hypothetical protein
MKIHAAGCAALALLMASAARGESHRQTGMEIYEDFVAAGAAAAKCAPPNPTRDAIYNHRLTLVAGHTRQLIVEQNRGMTPARATSTLATVSAGVTRKVNAEISAKGCGSPRISPLLYFHARRSMPRGPVSRTAF